MARSDHKVSGILGRLLSWGDCVGRWRPTVLKPPFGARSDWPAVRSWTAPIFPWSNRTARSLILAIMILTFLAAILCAGAFLAAQAAGTWRQDAAREFTVYFPHTLDEAEVLRVETFFDQFVEQEAGIAAAERLSRQEVFGLISSWLPEAESDDFSLPLPTVVRLIRHPDLPVSTSRISLAIREFAPDARFDDHRAWRKSTREIGSLVLFFSLFIVVLAIVAVATINIAATRNTLEIYRQYIHVLFDSGATIDFIANEYFKHFLKLGVFGSGLGGAAAIVIVFSRHWIERSFPTYTQHLHLPVDTGQIVYLLIVVIVFLTGVCSAVTARLTVARALRHSRDFLWLS